MINSLATFVGFSFLYLFPLAISFAAFNANSSSDKYRLCVYAISATFFSYVAFYSLKNFSFADDFHTYYYYLQRIAGMPDFSYMPLSGGDSFFWYPIYLFGKLEFSTYLLSVVFASIFSLFILQLTRNVPIETAVMVIILVLFSRAFIESTVNPVRSSIASCFFLFSYISFFKKSYLTALFFLFIGFNFHDSIIFLYLFIFPLVFIKIKFLKILLISSIFIFLIIPFIPATKNIIDFLNLVKIVPYTEYSYPINFIIQIIPFVIFPAIFLINKDFDNKNDLFLFKLMLILLIVSLLSLPFVNYASRFSILTIPIGTILLFKHFNEESKKFSKPFFIIILIFNYSIISKNIIDKKYYFDTEQKHYIDATIIK